MVARLLHCNKKIALISINGAATAARVAAFPITRVARLDAMPRER
jgi:hypothetical protein